MATWENVIDSWWPCHPRNTACGEVALGHFVQEAPACNLKLILLCSFLLLERSFSKGRQPMGDSEFVIHWTYLGPSWGKVVSPSHQSRQGFDRAATPLSPAGRGRPLPLQGPELKFSLTARQTGRQAGRNLTRTNLGYTHTCTRTCTHTLGT